MKREPDTSAEPARRWFVVEIWYDIREPFKAIVGDAVLFAIVLGALELFGRLLTATHLDKEQKRILESMHFWGLFAVGLILGLDLIVKILLASVRGRKS